MTRIEMYWLEAEETWQSFLSQERFEPGSIMPTIFREQPIILHTYMYNSFNLLTIIRIYSATVHMAVAETTSYLS
jgi:hypothetical protein